MTYYHGSTMLEGQHMLMPPSETGIIQERGRKKNLDKVFFTPDLGTAKIYAGRSKNVNGGNPAIYRVIPMGDVVKINDLTYMCDWAFIEPINN